MLETVVPARGEKIKVMIVDDNAEISKILSEMLSAGNHTAEAYGSIADAIGRFAQFAPDAVIVNMTVNGKNASDAVRTFGAGDERPKIIVIVKNGEEADRTLPADCWIKRPYSGTSILEKLDAQGAEREKASFLGKLLEKIDIKRTRKKDNEEGGMRLRFGTSYMFTEEEPSALNAACRHFADNGSEIFYLTSGNAKAAEEMFGYGKIKVMVISEKKGERYISGLRTGSIASEMMAFASVSARPVIAVDDLGLLISMNGIGHVLAMMHRVITGPGKEMTVLASLMPDIITERDRDLFLNDMTSYTSGEAV